MYESTVDPSGEPCEHAGPARVLSQWDSVIEDDDDPGDKNPFAFDVDEEEEDEDEEDSSVIDERRKEN